MFLTEDKSIYRTTELRIPVITLFVLYEYNVAVNTRANKGMFSNT